VVSDLIFESRKFSGTPKKALPNFGMFRKEYFCNKSAKTKNWKAFHVVPMIRNQFFKICPFFMFLKNLPRKKNGTSVTLKLNQDFENVNIFFETGIKTLTILISFSRLGSRLGINFSRPGLSLKNWGGSLRSRFSGGPPDLSLKLVFQVISFYRIN